MSLAVPDAAEVAGSLHPSGDASARVETGTARALNVQIRRIADMLPGGLEHVYGFSCECGCGQTFQLSAADFDHQGGAWLDGHNDDRGPE